MLHFEPTLRPKTTLQRVLLSGLLTVLTLAMLVGLERLIWPDQPSMTYLLEHYEPESVNDNVHPVYTPEIEAQIEYLPLR